MSEQSDINMQGDFMKNKRFWISIVAVWVVMGVTDWLFHGWWLSEIYKNTAQFWRPQEDIKTWWVWISNFCFSYAFVWIYSKGIGNDNQWVQAFRYAIAILMVSRWPSVLEQWAMTPYPNELVVKWAFVVFVQAIVASYVMTWTFKPVLKLQTSTHG